MLTEKNFLGQTKHFSGKYGAALSGEIKYKNVQNLFCQLLFSQTSGGFLLRY